MIDLEPEFLQIIQNICQKMFPAQEVWLFGSRANGTAQPYSDIDLVIMGDHEIPWRDIEKAKDILSETDIPYMVDIIDWQSIPASFQDVIKSSSSEIIHAPASPRKK